MAGVTRRFCGLFSNKEAVTVILWYAVFNCMAPNDNYPDFLNVNNTAITAIYTTMYISLIVSYLILGLLADAFIGRYRLIQFSLWVKLIAVIMSTLMTALMHEYHLQDWLLGLLFSILSAIEMLGHSSFHVVAIQFGIDQLQGAPSDHLSAFVFWYYMAESIPYVIYQWGYCLLSFIYFNPISIQLGVSLFNAVFFSVVLSIKNYFMSNWFVRETATLSITVTQTNRNHSYYSCNSNPYRLIFHVLKFAKEHKSPVQRSALTYWEDEIPSRIDLGKRKYGGPFTTEEVENVKTFLQLLKLLFSLSGVLVALSFSPASIMDLMSESDGTLMQLIGVIYYTAAVVLLIPCRATCYVHKCHLSLLKRIGIGAALIIVYLVSILLIISIECATSMNVHTVSYAILILRNFLYHISYFVLSVSLIEFIIAQSPHTTKGLLIGVFYAIQFGVGGLLLLIQTFFCEYVHTGNIMSCSKIFLTIVIIIAVLSFIMYCVVAYKYKLRERDEVVNVHIFAEEYYGNHKEDSYEDYSDVDD